MKRQHTPRVRIVQAFAPFVVALGLVFALAAQANAQPAPVATCGEYSFGFAGTRLIHDGISESAGPYAITLPAGTYDIEMRSHDNHPTPDYQVDQTEEQWYFVLDSGYVSPFTLDIPADAETTVTRVAGVDIAESTAITVRHRGVGTVNSVNVVCVGFTPSEVIAGPTTTVAPAAPATTTPPASVAPTTPVPTTAVTQVEDAAVVQPQLALTGPGRSDMLLFTGVALILLGTALVVVDVRTRDV